MHVIRFCPNPDCRFHDPGYAKKHGAFYQAFGTYMTKVVGAVQRYRCTACGKGFSDRTFSIDYYTKKKFDYHEIHRAISEAESVSAIARSQSGSIDSIQNRLDRLGRNCIAMHSGIIGAMKLSEDLVADGFEAFDRSQYFPNQIHLLVGKESQFLYSVNHATIRRKGRMTDSQKRKRDAIERVFKPERGAVRHSFTGILHDADRIWDRSTMSRLVLRTDEHRAYPRAIRHVIPLVLSFHHGKFSHEKYSSKIDRTIVNPLFAVNYYDRELRKDIAAFRRESTCFSRNVSNGLLRFQCHMAWHNYVKRHRINPGPTSLVTHAEVAGANIELISREFRHLYTRRAFLSHKSLSHEEKKIWLKKKVTPLKVGADYCPGFASWGKSTSFEELPST